MAPNKPSTSNFQITLMIVFGVAILVAVLMFAGFIKVGKNASTDVTGSVTIWGTIGRIAMADFLDQYATANQNIRLTYVQKNTETFNQDLVEALASGIGPDLVFLPQDLLIKHKDRLFIVPYQTVTARSITDLFAREGQLVLSKEGVMGFPVSIDPLVLYYNRDLFDKAGIAIVPKTWEEVAGLVPQLTSIDVTNHTVNQSAIALGEYANIQNAKDILSMFMLQSGTTIVSERDDGSYYCSLREALSGGSGALENSVDYFLKFSNPTDPSYSWNRGLPNSRDSFVLGKLAMYIGYASELFEIQQKNPNLNYDVAQLPQFSGSSAAVTYGKMLSVGIMKATKNFNASYSVLSTLSGADFQGKLASKLSLPSPRRDLLAIKPDNAYAQSFYTAALTSRGWLDPNPDRTGPIFSDFLGNISSGRLDFEQSVGDLCAKMDSIIFNK